MQVIEISPDSIARGKRVAKGQVNIHNLDRPLQKMPKVGKALDSFLTTYFSIMDSFSESPPCKDKEVMNLFALYAGARQGIKHLPNNYYPDFKPDLEGLNFRTKRLDEYKYSIDSLIKNMGLRLRHQDAEGHIAGALHNIESAVFDYLGDNIDRLAPSYEQVQNLSIRYNGVTFNGFGLDLISGSSVEDVPGDGRGPVSSSDTKETIIVPSRNVISTPPRIVGNENALETIDLYLKIIGLYDMSVQANPVFHGVDRPKPLSVFLEGRPGVGKTLLINYAEAGLKRIAQMKGVPYNAQLVRGDFKDKWHGNDAKILRAMFDKVDDPFALGSLAIDDGESIFGSRRTSDELTNATNIQMMLDYLGGIDTEYRGNHLTLLTTNYPDRLDSAFVERFTKCIPITGPETSDQYEELLRIRMGPAFGYVRDTGEFGKVCVENDLSGRNVAMIAQGLSEKVQNLKEIDDGMFNQGYDSNLANLEELRQVVDKADVYVAFEGELVKRQDRDYMSG